jgi:hypothetical protein
MEEDLKHLIDQKIISAGASSDGKEFEINLDNGGTLRFLKEKTNGKLEKCSCRTIVTLNGCIIWTSPH